jgi:hypothetical protein
MSQSVRGRTVEKSSVSQRVITAVAEATDNDPTEVGPLYHVIDPDALDRLFAATATNGRSHGRVEFSFGGCEVVVHGNGAVDVTETDRASDASNAEAEADSRPSRADADGAQ